MRSIPSSLVTAVQEHILGGAPITGLESLVLFGVPSLTKVISDLRKQGWIVHSQQIPYAGALARIRKHAVLVPPSNLPVREIRLTEYWVSR